MLISSISTFIYSILLGCVWAEGFKKKFSSSLPLAFMTHIIVVLLSGLVIHNLSIGIFGGLFIAVISGIIILIRNKNSISKQAVMEYIKKIWREGAFIYSVFYIFCFVTNSGKLFISWDEFSHWGMFIKESLRLDRLYCMSPLNFAHKDYVPAVTLFEVIWCKLSGRYTEQSAYNAIQIFMFSLLMPAIDNICEFSSERIKENKEGRDCYRYQLIAIIVVLLVPLMFNTSNAFMFYHSIYCDVAVGILFFWCLLEAYRDRDEVQYQFLSMTIGLTILVLSKMIAMALLPLAFFLFIVRLALCSKEKIKASHCFFAIPMVGLPVILWIWFNRFVDIYVDNTGDIQSYDGLKLEMLSEVFTSPKNSPITYLKQVKDAYIEAIFHRDILLHGSYVVVILAAVIILYIMSRFANDPLTRRKMMIAGAWVVGSGSFYGILIYFLYCTSFSEYEAVHLASYERYMNSFVIAVVYLIIAAYYDSDIWKKNIKSYYCLVILLLFDLAFLHVTAFDQILPGTIMHDEEKVSGYIAHAVTIMEKTDENDTIYIVARGDDGNFIWHQRYYCSPRTIDGGSIGPAVYDGDIWSSDITVTEFISSVKEHDYIYFSGLDDAFLEKYSAGFADPELLVNGAIYKITDADSKIYLEQD